MFLRDNGRQVRESPFSLLLLPSVVLLTMLWMPQSQTRSRINLSIAVREDYSADGDAWSRKLRGPKSLSLNPGGRVPRGGES